MKGVVTIKKNKKLAKLFFITALASTISPLIVDADDLYKVEGNSMNPLLKDGDVVRQVSTEYKEGDLVLAKVRKTGDIIVKRLEEDALIGEGDFSKNYQLKDVKILGKAQKFIKKVDDNNLPHAKAEVMSPIKSVYATNSTVLFLHDDTSLSGIGENVEGIFGTANTGTIKQVSEPTGYTKIQAVPSNRNTYRKFYGFKQKDTGENLYQAYEIKGEDDSVLFNGEFIKDYEWVNPLWGTNEYKIDKNGELTAYGSESAGYRLGIGKGYPYGRLDTLEFKKVLDVEGNGEIVVAEGEEYNHTDKYQEANFTTPLFNISNSSPNWQIKVKNMERIQKDWNTATLDIEVIDENNNVIKTFTKPWDPSKNDSNYFTTERAFVLENQPGTYKLRIRSKEIKYNISIEERHDFPNEVVKVDTLGTEGGSYNIVDELGANYVHRVGFGLLKRVEFPEGVKIIPETISGGYTSFVGIDEEGKAWYWSDSTPTMVNFKTLDDGSSFYEKFKVKEIDSGRSSLLMIVEDRVTGETTVWAQGSNEYGKLGVDVGEVSSNPVQIVRSGKPLTNIQSVAMGEYFSVVVQNTDSGQLVWTFGKNESGQLGGGIKLSINEPLVVPGLNNITGISNYNGESYAYNSNTIYSFGGSKSYVGGKVFNEAMGHVIPKFNNGGFPQAFLTWDEREAWTAGDCCYGSAGDPEGDRTTYGPVKPQNNFLEYSGVNSATGTFKNVKSIYIAGRAGNLIDKDGRIWGWGRRDNAGVGKSYDSFNRQIDVYGARPAMMNENTEAPLGFEKIVGATDDWTSSGPAFALKEGKLWRLKEYTVPVPSTEPVNNVEMVNIFGNSKHFLGIDSNGRLWTWGDNSNGKLGINNRTNKMYPTLVDPSYYDNKKVISADAGKEHSIFVTEDGSVYAMGDNSEGQLGTGNNITSYTPIKVENLKNIVQVSAADNYSLALDKEGRVWGWGYVGNGSLGNNFPLSREMPSTAVGNDLPVMSLKNDIKTTYLSKNGNKYFELSGEVTEKDAEDVTVKANVLGVDKEQNLSDWGFNIYEEIEPQTWNLIWDISEFSQDYNFQSLIKITAEDSRGGIVEQFYAGGIVIDNEKPQTPIWGNTCVVEVDGTEACHESDYFKMNDSKSVNKPVRIYIKPIQKTGDNTAPVRAQIRYRIKQTYGYPPTWSDWIDVDKSNDNGYYYEFMQGFLGETQIQTRAIDLAGNKSEESEDYRYVNISDAGGEVSKISATTKTVNKKLENIISFSASTPSNLKSYAIRQRKGTEQDWITLTEPRTVWGTGSEETYTDNSDYLEGNTRYEYAVDIENTVAIGKEKIISVTTNPYEPTNFIRKLSLNGLKFTAKQDQRNNGTILYRLVLTDNRTGEIYTTDKTSNNVKEEVIFNINEGDAPFPLLNNDLTVKLLLKGDNEQFQTIIYDENFETSPSIISDKKEPDVFVSVEGNLDTIITNGTNLVNLNLSASDNVTVNDRLVAQFSSDGTNWYGLAENGAWERNIWSNYNLVYKNFPLGRTAGQKIIYARVKDEAGNIGTGKTKITVSTLVERDSSANIVDLNKNVSSSNTLNDNTIHINTSYIALKVPKTGNTKEVQFSFDGITWSEWEPLFDDSVKYISLPNIEGEHDIFVRYRNEFGDVTEMNEESDVIRYTLDKEKPDLKLETANGTYIVKSNSTLLNLLASDNLSKKIEVELADNTYQMYIDGVKTTKSTFVNNSKREVRIDGLVNGFNVISFKISDEAGNIKTVNIRIFKK